MPFDTKTRFILSKTNTVSCGLKGTKSPVPMIIFYNNFWIENVKKNY